MVRAVSVVDWIATLDDIETVKTIEETVDIVALRVAFAIAEDLPAFDVRCAVPPWVYAKGTVPSIKVTRKRVAFLITASVA